jgi:hypothetical protein
MRVHAGQLRFRSPVLPLTGKGIWGKNGLLFGAWGDLSADGAVIPNPPSIQKRCTVGSER